MTSNIYLKLIVTDDTNLFNLDENVGELFQKMNKELKCLYLV